jgi:hypothetical protein
LSHTSSLFCSGYFGDTLLAFYPAALIVLLYASCPSWNDSHVPTLLAFSLEMGFHELLLGLASNCDTPDLSLPSVSDYRNDPPCQATK